ncbi:MAG: hypothetical protein V1794_03765 [Candidatus Glassbacteria bacterium]
MKKGMAYILFAGTVVGATACTSAGNVRRSAMSEEERAFRATCTSCHSLPDPSSKTDEEWVVIVERHAKMLGLQAVDQEKILRYLQQSN